MAERITYSMAFDKAALVVFKRTDTIDDKGKLLNTVRDETRIDATEILKVFKK